MAGGLLGSSAKAAGKPQGLLGASNDIVGLLGRLFDPSFLADTTGPVNLAKVPYRMAAGLANTAYGAATLPGDVYAGRVDPLSDEGIGRANDLAGMIAGVGEGRAFMSPKGANELGAGGGRTSSGLKTNPIASVADIRKAIDDNGGRLFVRWSRGPKDDLIPSAVSRDYQSGRYHSGLSATEITNDLSDSQLLNFLKDYSYLVDKNHNKTTAHIYAGDIVGVDSDNSPSIAIKKYIGSFTKPFEKFVTDEKTSKRVNLMSMIDQGRRALAFYESNPPKPGEMIYWTPQKVAEFQAELDALGAAR